MWPQKHQEKLICFPQRPPPPPGYFQQPLNAFHRFQKALQYEAFSNDSFVPKWPPLPQRRGSLPGVGTLLANPTTTTLLVQEGQAVAGRLPKLHVSAPVA